MEFRVCVRPRRVSKLRRYQFVQGCDDLRAALKVVAAQNQHRKMEHPRCRPDSAGGYRTSYRRHEPCKRSWRCSETSHHKMTLPFANSSHRIQRSDGRMRRQFILVRSAKLCCATRLASSTTNETCARDAAATIGQLKFNGGPLTIHRAEANFVRSDGLVCAAWRSGWFFLVPGW